MAQSELPLKALSTSTSLSLLTKAFECVQCNKSHVWDSNWSLVYYVGHYSHLSFFLWCTIKSYCIVYNQGNPRDFLDLCWFCHPLVWLKYNCITFFLYHLFNPVTFNTQKKCYSKSGDFNIFPIVKIAVQPHLWSTFLVGCFSSDSFIHNADYRTCY